MISDDSEDNMDNVDTTLADRFGIQAGDGLQTRCWAHNTCTSFCCVLCGSDGGYEMRYASITLFDGQKVLGDLCDACVAAGPCKVGKRIRKYADEIREQQALRLEKLADDLSDIERARWSTLAELHAVQELVRKEMQTGEHSDV